MLLLFCISDIFMISCKQKCSVMLRTHQIVFHRGSAPELAWGAHDAPPYLYSQLGRGIPSPHSPPCRRLRRLTLS